MESFDLVSVIECDFFSILLLTSLLTARRSFLSACVSLFIVL